jgi:hypothetical protein
MWQFFKRKVDSDDSSDEDATGTMEVDSDSTTDEEGFVTELDQYLKSARVKDVKDPLKWWFENRGSYPRLSRMARDFLMIPGETLFFVGSSI